MLHVEISMNFPQISPMYRIQETQFLPITKEEGWAFLSDPKNLGKITPPSMDFKIISGAETRMYAGQMISYTVKPLLGIPITWVSEITHVEEGSFFVDEQRLGPYKLWHHQHHLREVNGGIEIEDVIHYILPGGPFGALLHHVLVRAQLDSIFHFRRMKLEEMFGTNSSSIDIQREHDDAKSHL